MRPFVAVVTKLLSIGIVGLTAVGCATTEPKHFQQLSSTAQLRSNAGSNHPFLYRGENVNFSRYSSVIVDPVTVYEAGDGQFGTVKGEDKAIVANYLGEQLNKALATKYSIVQAPSPSTARIKATLTGMATSTPVLSTMMRLAPGGLLMNTRKAITGDEGMLMGSITYAVEITESTDNQLLCAYVRKSNPHAMDIGSTIGYLDASKTGADRAAKDLLKFLEANCNPP
ncbi:MAG: DUF3313 domain-containing protein [Alphaproteobacteria bacterium]|nr:DUF3313 domain-containing protein [Alphaproteobacteria bacterium]